jgi:polar amino acid transport system permease protein
MSTFDLDVLTHGETHAWLLTGLRVSLELTGVALACAAPLALGVVGLRLSPLAPLRALGAAFVAVVRGVPLLAHLLFWYFGVPELLPEAARAWLVEHEPEFWCATAALSIYGAAYLAEDLRSGFRAIPRGQLEAARALGLGWLAALGLVVAPQALRAALPALVSQTLNLWKDSSVATVIGLGEMMYQAARVESATFRSAEAFAFVTVAYLAVSLALTGLASRLDPARAAHVP